MPPPVENEDVILPLDGPVVKAEDVAVASLFRLKSFFLPLPPVPFLLVEPPDAFRAPRWKAPRDVRELPLPKLALPPPRPLLRFAGGRDWDRMGARDTPLGANVCACETGKL